MSLQTDVGAVCTKHRCVVIAAGLDERGAATPDDVERGQIVFCLAAIKYAYSQLVQELAKQGGLPEQRVHNDIAELINTGTFELRKES